MLKTIIVVPTYNESENITKLITALLALRIPGLEVLVVDDNSPDGTGKLVDELAAANHGRVHCLHRAGKLGLGTAYIEGFRWALDQGADFICQMDADFSHDPKYVPQLYEQAQRFDVVFGSRYVKGGTVDERWSVWRRLLSWWANRVWVGTILRTPIYDNTCGFRMWQRKTLIGLDLARVRSNGYIFQVEMTYLALKLGYQTFEVPVYFADRKYGLSKMGLHVQIESAIGVFQVWWRNHNLSAADRATGG